MKVILQRDIPKVGKDGDIVVVKDGYARNYLLPRALAVTATGGALKEHTARQNRESERGTKLLQSAQANANKLEGLALTLIAKVGSGTKLYGSITAQDIAESILKETGVTVDKRRIGLVDPIKVLGNYTIPVRLHADMSVSIKVEVLTAEDLERRKAQEAASAAAAAAASSASSPADAQEAAAPTAISDSLEDNAVTEAEATTSAEEPTE